MGNITDNEKIILFDGVCNLCEASVIFIFKRDRKGKFRFARVQSDVGLALLEGAGIKRDDFDTIVLISGGVAYTKSTAMLKILKELDGFWPIFFALIIIPGPLRDALYTFIAKNRYRWFGKKEVCMVPDAELKNRFLG
jgi:predicted DCC family thiol-disulfide oxidoreductase YuxK